MRSHLDMRMQSLRTNPGGTAVIPGPVFLYRFFPVSLHRKSNENTDN